MRKLARFLVWTALIVGALVGLLRATTLRWWQVPTQDPVLTASLSPTLGAGDWILLWRLTEPTVGDLALCADPQSPSRVVVARIYAEEGERVRVSEGGDVFVNDKPAAGERGCDPFTERDPTTKLSVQQTCSEVVVRGRTHPRGDRMSQELRGSGLTQDREVPKGQVFLVSDNRHFPYDSREYGSVPRDTCKEFAFFRLWGPGGYWETTRRFNYIH